MFAAFPVINFGFFEDFLFFARLANTGFDFSPNFLCFTPFSDFDLIPCFLDFTLISVSFALVGPFLCGSTLVFNFLFVTGVPEPGRRFKLG